MTQTKPDPMSVRLKSSIVIQIGNHKQTLTMEKARDLHSRLAKFISGTAQSDGVQRVRVIQKCTIEHFGLSGEIFLSDARHEVYTWPRFVAMALSHELVHDLGPREIGNEFGRERSMVGYAVKEVASRLATYPEKRKDVDAIRAKLNGGAH